MKTVFGLIALTLVALAVAPVDIAAQDLAIVNARILDGKGGVIERGSVVVIYTDGVSEAENSERDQYGLERLSDVVSRNKEKSASSIHTDIRAALSEFVGDHRANDDSTMIVLKF